jgi:hypothetical protein
MADGKAAPGEVTGTCPRCGEPLRAVGLVGARLLAQVRRYPSDSMRPGVGTAGRRPPPRRRLR